MPTDKPSYPSDVADKFIVRLPPGMREQIAEAAKANTRTMNAEIVARLQFSFQPGLVDMSRFKGPITAATYELDPVVKAVREEVRALLIEEGAELFRRAANASPSTENSDSENAPEGPAGKARPNAGAGLIKKRR